MDFFSSFIKRPISLVMSESNMNALNDNSGANSSIEADIPSKESLDKKIDYSASEVEAEHGKNQIININVMCVPAATKSQYEEQSSSGEEFSIELGDNDQSPLNTKDSGEIAANKSNLILPSVTNGSGQKMSNTKEPIVQQQAALAAVTIGSDLISTTKNDELNADIPKRFSDRFIGLNEYDEEAHMSELSTTLSGDLDEEDPLKLTFNESNAPTICMNSTTSLNFTTCPNGSVTSNHSHLQTPNNDSDTAVSSDNEIYAECLSYRECELSDKFPLEMSNAEHYRSALNSHSNTINDCDAHNLDTTIESEIRDEINAENLIPDKDVFNTQSSEVEPMDVDMNSTLEMSNTSQNFTLEIINELEKLKLEEQETMSEKVTVNETRISDENEASKVDSIVLKEVPSNSVRSEEKLFLNIEIQNEPASNTKIENYKIPNDAIEIIKYREELKNSTASTVKNSDIISSKISKESLDQKDSLSMAIDKQSRTESKLSLLIDTVLSANQNSSEENCQLSPSFPVKPVNEKTKFPTSPVALEGPPSFLEQSEYTEYSNAQAEKSLEQPTVEVFCSSPNIERNKAAGDSNIHKEINDDISINYPISPSIDVEHISNTAPDINTTVTVSDTAPDINTTVTVSDISPLSANDATFDGSFNMISAKKIDTTFPIQTPDDKRRTFTVSVLPAEMEESLVEGNKRLTYNSNTQILHEDVTSEDTNTTFENCKTFNDPDPKMPQEDATPEEINKKSDNRRTFNVFNPDPVPLATSEKVLNTSYEPMDVDESFSITMPNSSNHSSEQSQILPTFTPAFSAPGTSPLTMITNRPTICSVATAAAAQILSKSPPLPTCPETIPNQEKISMVPPLTSPSQNTTRNSKSVDVPHNLTEVLSIKEQTKLNSKDEKDIFVEKFTPSPIEETFANEQFKTQLNDAEFSNNIIFQQSDFEFLLTKGGNDKPIDRCSVLLRFDPLLGQPIPVNTTQQQQQALQHFLQKATTGTCATATTIKDEEPIKVQAETSCTKLNELETNPLQEEQQRKTDIQEPAIKVKEVIFQQSDFEFLLNKGGNDKPIDRCSVLLRFDPLVGHPIPVNTTQQQQQTLQHFLQKATTGTCATATTIKDEEHIKLQAETSCTKLNELETNPLQEEQQRKTDIQEPAIKKHANMSLDVIKDINIDNDCIKSKEHMNTQTDEKQVNFKMDELEKKIKNEVLKTEDIEKKLKEAEQREEASIKRITEKDKTISKLNGVIEAYEKAIAELIAEKEQLVHNYEKQLVEIKADRDSNYHHLMSLESTFSDLHVKYEKSKDMTLQLKGNEEALLAEKRQNLENLRMQEQRYEKMKNHAMQQLEIANKTLESMKKEHAVETTKLKALLKKEEISRASTNEQLQQKMRENEELVKICDELINGQGS